MKRAPPYLLHLYIRLRLRALSIIRYVRGRGNGNKQGVDIMFVFNNFLNHYEVRPPPGLSEMIILAGVLF